MQAFRQRASSLKNKSKNKANNNSDKSSLYKGIGGQIILFSDLIDENGKYPGFEI